MLWPCISGLCAPLHVHPAADELQVDDEAAAAAPKLKKPKAVKLAVAKPKAAAASSQTPGKAFNAFSDEMSAQLKGAHLQQPGPASAVAERC